MAARADLAFYYCRLEQEAAEKGAAWRPENVKYSAPPNYFKLQVFVCSPFTLHIAPDKQVRVCGSSLFATNVSDH
jgi:hypothetical protein